MQKSKTRKLPQHHQHPNSFSSSNNSTSPTIEIEMSSSTAITTNNNKNNNKSAEKAPLLSGSAISNNNDDTNISSPINNANNNNNNTIVMTEEELEKHIRAKTSLIIAIVFCVIFMIVECVSGVIAHSLAIMTDAAHMLCDVGSLALSLFAVVASQWQASDQFTFGFKRAEVVGALFSIMLVWGLVGVIIYEGIFRLIEIISCARGTQSQYTECEGTEPRIMLIVGCCGLIVNIGYAIILAWGGAEVKHAHSHGGEGGCDHGHGGHSHAQHGTVHSSSSHHDHHGHSHSHNNNSHGHSHNNNSATATSCNNTDHHGHSHHSHQTGSNLSSSNDSNNNNAADIVEKIKCCEPIPEELDCEKADCDHAHLKNVEAAKKQNNSKKNRQNNNNNNNPVISYTSLDSSAAIAVSKRVEGSSIQEDENSNSTNNISQQQSTIAKENHHDHHDHHDHDHDHDETDNNSAAGASGVTCWDSLFGSSANMNIRGAAIHALGDCLQSVGVIIAAGVIWYGCGVGGKAHSYYNIADPACSLLFAVITLWTTKSLFVEVFDILMERAPRGIHVSCIKRKLEHYPAIVEVKDIFIWSITNERTALGAHCVVSRDATPDQIFKTLDKARNLCVQLGFHMSAIEVLREGDESAREYKSINGPASPKKED